MGYMGTIPGQDEDRVVLLHVHAILDEHSDEVDGDFEMENEQMLDEYSDNSWEIDDNQKKLS